VFLQGSYKVTFVRPAGAYPPRELGRQIRIKARSRYHIESGPTPSGDTNIMCVSQHPQTASHSNGQRFQRIIEGG